MKNNEEFRPLPFFLEMFLKKEELQEYYIKKREYQYQHNQHLRGQKIRDALHPVLLSLMAFARKYTNKQTLTIINDERKQSDKPVIYAITHVGMYDLQIVSEAIRDHQYTFMGDPETMYRTGDGLIMSLNGVVYCDTDDKGEFAQGNTYIDTTGEEHTDIYVKRESDRKIAKNVAVDVLKSGNNLMIYPEGVWNLSPNLLSLPLFPGIIDIALETNCEIIPVAIEQYDKDFVVNIGKNINVNPDNKTFATETERKSYIEEQKENLRDTMATLKWNIFKTRPLEQRAKYGTYEEEYRKYVDTRYNEWVNKKTKKPYYNDEIVRKRTFKVKNVHFAEDVFAHLRNLKLNKNNAFLFRNYQGATPEIEAELTNKLKR